jgi:hypothetical protein
MAIRLAKILCYTLFMSEDQQNWITWARTLQKWGLRETAASLLDSAGSLSILLAQILYLSQPLLSGTISSHSLQAFAQVLENPVDRKEFVSFLRETSSHATGT